MWPSSQMYLIAFVLMYLSSESSSVDVSSIEAKFYSYYSELRSFSTKLPSSKCSKAIMSPVCSWDDAVYVIYNTYGCIASASEYSSDIYANALETLSSNTTSFEKTILCVLGT